MQQLAFRAMGCQMRAMLDDERATGGAALKQVPRLFAAWEQELSRFRADSTLSVLNRDGYLSSAPPVLWQVIQLALAHARATEGLVTPTLIAALEAAGYDRSFAALPQTAAAPPTTESSSSPAEHIGRADRSRSDHRQALLPHAQPYATDMRFVWQAIHCDPATRSIHLPAGVRLDLGGCAKGWAADEAVRHLASFGPALVDAGGDIAVNGPQAAGTPWPIGVADPWNPDHQIDLLLLRQGGVATSGRDYRRWQRDGIWQHHLIDPRTMRPAITDVLSATIVGPSAAQCDAVAKVVLLLGSCDGLRWLEARPPFAGLIILENGTVLRSRRLQAVQWQEPSEKDMHHER
jgi:thiamine biosynthesis lipoprotein